MDYYGIQYAIDAVDACVILHNICDLNNDTGIRSGFILMNQFKITVHYMLICHNNAVNQLLVSVMHQRTIYAYTNATTLVIDNHNNIRYFIQVTQY